MVGYYFDKKRALATGIAVCGSGIGSFVFAPLCKLLLDEFDWKGAMWIISALVLHGMVFAGLFRPLVFSDKQLHHSEGSDQVNKGDTNNICNFKIHDEHGLNVPVSNPREKELTILSKGPIYRCRSLELNSPSKDNKTNTASETARLGNSLFLDEAGIHKHSSQNKHILNPLVRKDIFYSGSIHHLPEYTKAGNEENFVKSMLSTSTVVFSEESEDKSKFSCVRNVFAGMFDLSLLRSPTFILYGLSCFLCMIGKTYLFTMFVFRHTIVISQLAFYLKT